jgi:hypothetical protein
MNGRTIRNVTMLFWWLFVTGCTLVVNGWAVLEHYLSAKSALEIAGTETQPLSNDPLFGPLLGAFIPDASLAQAQALTIAAVLTVAFFMVFKEVFTLVELISYRHSRTAAIENINSQAEAELNGLDDQGRGVGSEGELRGYVEGERDAAISSEREEARAASEEIVVASIVLAVFALLLVWAINYELDLFQFRVLAAGMGIDNPQDANKILSLSTTLSQHRDVYIYLLAGSGAWGYLALTALGCLALERCFNRLDRRFNNLFSSQQVEEDFEQYDQEEEPTQETPSDDVGVVEGEFESGDVVRLPVRPVGAEPAPVARADEGLFATSPVAVPAQSQRGDVDEQSGVPQNTSPLRDVVGGPAGQRVTLAEALADPDRYVVNSATGQVWDRDYWDLIHGYSSEQDAPKAA